MSILNILAQIPGITLDTYKFIINLLGVILLILILIYVALTSRSE